MICIIYYYIILYYMNDKILNLDNKIKLKKTVENNIIYVIKNYAINIDQIKTKFIQYRKQYIMSILYNNIKILLIIEEIYNPLTMDKEYIISTTNSENNNNTVYSNNNSYMGMPALEISFLTNKFKKNEALINQISKNKKHKIDSGTIAVNLAIRLCSYLNVNYAYIDEDSHVKCEKNNKNDYYNKMDDRPYWKNNNIRLSLKLLKLLTTGNTFYNRFGFKLNVKDYSKINKAIIQVQKIKMADILKINIKIRDIISKVIENGDIDKIKFWEPNLIDYKHIDIKFLNSYYLYLTQNITILKKYIKKGDTIKIYSERISKDNCDIYIKTIQYFFIYPVYDSYILFYEDNIIAYPNINELYILKYLAEDIDIHYKKKI